MPDPNLVTILADANCRGVPAPVQKRAKADWKKHAPPALFDLVKTKFKQLKGMDWEVTTQLDTFEKAVADAGLDFDVVAFAREVYRRSQPSELPIGSGFLIPRDADIARERLLACVNVDEKKLKFNFNLDTLPDTLFDALPAVRRHCAFEKLEFGAANLTGHRLSELMKGVKKVDCSVSDAAALPPELFTPELIWLTVFGPKLKELPEEMGNATSVWMLDINAGKVKALPKSLSKLPLQSFMLNVSLPKLDISQWPTLRFLYLNGTIKKVTGHSKLPALEEYTQRCGMKEVPEELWNVPKLTRVWIWYDGFNDFDEVKAKFQKRGVNFAQS